MHRERHIDAQLFTSIDDNIYVVQPGKRGCDNTVFQTLCPHNHSTDEKAAAPVVEDQTPKKANPVALYAPSLSASERVRAWETAAAFPPPPADSFVRNVGASVDISGVELFTDEEYKDDPARHEEQSANAEKVAEVPFYLRLREVEKRFREQMDVHRGLDKAERELQMTESSVKLFRSEQRTRAILQSLHDRQESLWQRVWMGRAIPDVAAEMQGNSLLATSTNAAGRVAPFPTNTTRPPAPTPAAKVFPTAAASPTTPTSAASPTSDLLKDILNTFSKPRELRGDGSSTGRAAASPLTPGAGVVQGKSQDATSFSKERVAARAKEIEDVFPPPKRVTASGVEIVGPPRPPRSYRVVRYVEVKARRSSSDAGPGPQSRDHLRRATTAPQTSETPNSDSTISEEYSDDDFTADVDDELSELSSGSAESAVESGNASVQTSSVAEDDGVDEHYSSSSFESVGDDSELDDAVRHRARVGAASSQFSSVAQSVGSSAAPPFTISESVVDDVDDSTLLTSSVPETGSGEGVGIANGSLHGRDKTTRRNGAEKPRAATTDEVVDRFLAACDAVNAAATQLLRAPFLQKSEPRTQTKKSRAPAAAATTTTTTTTSESSTATRPSIRTTADRKDNNSSSSDSGDAHVAHESFAFVVDVPPRTWKDELEKQLRNVRHLRRFRAHLLHHLELVESHWNASREKADLLRETQQLAKVRQALLHSSSSKKGVALQDALSRIINSSHPQRSKAKAIYQKVRTNRPHPGMNFSRQRHHNGGSDDCIATDIATEMSDEAAAPSESGIEEDIEYEDDVVDGSGGEVSESIDDLADEWDGDHGSSGSISESISSMEPDAVASDVISTDASILEESSSAQASGSAARVRAGFLLLAGAGLDEIEEELADQLAELSSAALSEVSSDFASDGIPTEVEELIDLLPSSLTPSEVGEKAGHVGVSAASSIATESTIASEVSSSAKALQEQQRRVYAAVKRGAAAGNEAGKTNTKDYLRDSTASTVFTVSSDADVDTTMRSSTTRDNSAVEATNMADTPSQRGETVLEQPMLLADAKGQTVRKGGAAQEENTEEDEDDSDSLDALTALEMDMALTRKRRQAALRSATAVPSFQQLYNPLVAAVDTHGTLHGKEEKVGTNTDVSASTVTEADEVAQDTSPATDQTAKAAVEIVDEPSEAAVGDQSRSNEEDVPEAAQSVEAVAAAASPDPTVVAAPPPATFPQKAAAYAKEDMVAQNSWKARQLHLLRQLRDVHVGDAETVLPGSPDDTRDAAVHATQQTQMKASVDVAMDAAEEAAREEWAQHWGVLESLLQTRFASPRYESQMAPVPASRRRFHSSDFTAGGSATSANDASRSSLSASPSVSTVS